MLRAFFEPGLVVFEPLLPSCPGGCEKDLFARRQGLWDLAGPWLNLSVTPLYWRWRMHCLFAKSGAGCSATSRLECGLSFPSTARKRPEVLRDGPCKRGARQFL